MLFRSLRGASAGKGPPSRGFGGQGGGRTGVRRGLKARPPLGWGGDLGAADGCGDCGCLLPLRWRTARSVLPMSPGQMVHHVGFWRGVGRTEVRRGLKPALHWGGGHYLALTGEARGRAGGRSFLRRCRRSTGDPTGRGSGPVNRLRPGKWVQSGDLNARSPPILSKLRQLLPRIPFISMKS